VISRETAAEFYRQVWVRFPTWHSKTRGKGKGLVGVLSVGQPEQQDPCTFNQYIGFELALSVRYPSGCGFGRLQVAGPAMYHHYAHVCTPTCHHDETTALSTCMAKLFIAISRLLSATFEVFGSQLQVPLSSDVGLEAKRSDV
jgi:hypothetical protein